MRSLLHHENLDYCFWRTTTCVIPTMGRIIHMSKVSIEDTWGLSAWPHAINAHGHNKIVMSWVEKWLPLIGMNWEVLGGVPIKHSPVGIAWAWLAAQLSTSLYGNQLPMPHNLCPHSILPPTFHMQSRVYCRILITGPTTIYEACIE